jgi:hypothetical protein
MKWEVEQLQALRMDAAQALTRRGAMIAAKLAALPANLQRGAEVAYD